MSALFSQCNWQMRHECETDVAFDLWFPFHESIWLCLSASGEENFKEQVSYHRDFGDPHSSLHSWGKAILSYRSQMLSDEYVNEWMGICDIYKKKKTNPHTIVSTFFSVIVPIKTKILWWDLFLNFHNYESNSWTMQDLKFSVCYHCPLPPRPLQNGICWLIPVLCLCIDSRKKEQKNRCWVFAEVLQGCIERKKM